MCERSTKENYLTFSNVYFSLAHLFFLLLLLYGKHWLALTTQVDFKKVHTWILRNFELSNNVFVTTRKKRKHSNFFPQFIKNSKELGLRSPAEYVVWNSFIFWDWVKSSSFKSQWKTETLRIYLYLSLHINFINGIDAP